MSEPLQTTQSHTPIPLRPAPRITIASKTHPLRSRLEAFVEDRFETAFGARLPSHYPLLVGLFAPDGAVLAAAGVRFPEQEPLFLERYLDAPVEQAVAGAFGRPVEREAIVEIGGLASREPAASLELFTALACWLSSVCGRRYAVATTRPDLTRLLGRAGFGMRALGDAEPQRLGDGALAWGSYYAQSPRVFVGEIGMSPALPLLRQRLRSRALERQVRRLRKAAH